MVNMKGKRISNRTQFFCNALSGNSYSSDLFSFRTASVKISRRDDDSRPSRTDMRRALESVRDFEDAKQM